MCVEYFIPVRFARQPPLASTEYCSEGAAAYFAPARFAKQPPTSQHETGAQHVFQKGELHTSEPCSVPQFGAEPSAAVEGNPQEAKYAAPRSEQYLTVLS